MEVWRRETVSSTLLLVLTCTILFLMSGVSATRFIVGANMGWTSNVNYTEWAKGKHFYLGDWLFFVYDRNQMNVLEVNKTNYETCNENHPIHNWTTGAGRDVVPLNVTKTYYFISGKGFCYGGMKVAVHVEKLPPPPASLPEKSKNGSPSNYGSQIVLPAVFAIVALFWDNFIGFWY
ncbi:PREDICTED: lamin-like protein [Nelumbo nucifera]|uniref:Lamin-like protein n=1 Tax=Nelumbo nucifera TaxID=4432 RepID=A0A1U8A8C9_NELNU|nr:PREDICTED: lamin-like protein [Nelumbo nucifera]